LREDVNDGYPLIHPPEDRLRLLKRKWLASDLTALDSMDKKQAASSLLGSWISLPHFPSMFYKVLYHSFKCFPVS